MRRASPSAMAVLPTPADQQRIVLATTAERLDDALDFAFAADERVDLADQRLSVEVDGVRFQRTAGLLTFFLSLRFLGRLRLLRLPALGNAVRNEIDDIQASHSLLMQEVDGVRILLAEYGDQYVCAGHFLFTG